MSDHNDITRRDVVTALGIGGMTTIAGCSSGNGTGGNDGSGGTGDGGTNSSNPYGTGSGESTPASQQQSGSKARVALPTDPTAGPWAVYGGVTPYFTNVLEPLIWVTNEMGLKPWLATDWKSTGEKTWEFSLREGVKFHNGDDFTADAVVFSFKGAV